MVFEVYFRHKVYRDLHCEIVEAKNRDAAYDAVMEMIPDGYEITAVYNYIQERSAT